MTEEEAASLALSRANEARAFMAAIQTLIKLRLPRTIVDDTDRFKRVVEDMHAVMDANYPELDGADHIPLYVLFASSWACAILGKMKDWIK